MKEVAVGRRKCQKKSARSPPGGLFVGRLLFFRVNPADGTHRRRGGPGMPIASGWCRLGAVCSFQCRELPEFDLWTQMRLAVRLRPTANATRPEARRRAVEGSGTSVVRLSRIIGLTSADSFGCGTIRNHGSGLLKL